MQNNVHGDPNVYPMDGFNSKSLVMVEVVNMNYLYQLIEKAQHQSAELKETLLAIENFTPSVDLPK